VDESLAAGNENCCQPQMKWLFEQSRAANAVEKTKVGKEKVGRCRLDPRLTQG
jgi:hypothetical protein